MEQLRPPTSLNLEGNLAENWKEWIQCFELYLTATGIGEKPGKVQVAAFLHVAGIKARRMYNTFVIDDNDKEKCYVLKAKFKDYCEPRKNLTYTRHMFNTRSQLSHETFDSFVTDLKNKAQQCEFKNLKDGLIQDRIVCGTKDETCRRRLLRESDLTLAKAVDICRAHEVSAEQMKSLDQHEASAEVHAVSRQVRHKETNRYKRNKPHKTSAVQYKQIQSAESTKSCRSCGTQHGLGKSVCPADGKECYNCHKLNHFSKQCFTKDKMKPRPKAVHAVSHESDDEFFIGTVTVMDSIGQDPDTEDWTETVVISSKPVQFKLDTGAQANVLPETVYNSLQLKDKGLSKTKIKLVTYDENSIKPKGVKKIPVVFRGKTYDMNFYIVDINTQPILGRKTCSDIGSVVRVHSVEKTITKDEISQEYSDVFEGLGLLSGEHKIHLDPTVAPVVHPQRRVPAALRDNVRTEPDRMVSLGVIEKQDQPTDWVHSMVTVVKPGKTRLCINPKDLNRAIKREHYHLETIDEIAARLPNAKVFSRFDATHGFWQIGLDSESTKLLIFNTSPRYPKSNGQAERCVQTIKNLLKRADESQGDIYIGLLEYRASPIDGVNESPAKMLMDRQVKTKLRLLLRY